MKAGFSQSYQVAFRFGKSESFRDMERDAWRWAWESLKPKVTPVDVEVVRRTLPITWRPRLVVEDRAGIPFVIDAVSGKPGSFAGPRAASRRRCPARIANRRWRSGPRPASIWTPSS